MKMKKPRLLLVVLLGLSWVLPADATDDASAYLPLAVGNSWTYGHDYYDLNNEQDFFELYPAYFEAPRDEATQLPKFTITVRSTEVIDGKTYYVLSDMPANWPPPPPHFIAGKKLRWAGTHLMERTADGERSVFRFDGANDAGYAVETDEGDNLVKAIVYFDPNSYSFNFYCSELRSTRSCGFCGFLENYGCGSCDWAISGEDHPVFINHVRPLWAVLGGRKVEPEDLLVPTGTSSSSSWGQVKKEVH